MLRQLMRNVPSPVIVVTFPTLNGHKGITCSSFTSVSLEPPIVSFALQKRSSSLEHLEQFGINVLSNMQVTVSSHFASYKTQTDFTKIPHYFDSNIPLLQYSLGSMICSLDKTVDVGDHRVVFAKMDKYLESLGSINNDQLKPLLYYQSGYRSVGDAVFMRAFTEQELDFRDWTHRAHLRVAWTYLTELQNLEEAYPIIKEGILKYNEHNKHLIQHGYNETITRFFVNAIWLAIQNDVKQGTKGDFVDFTMRYPHLDNFSLIFDYYSSQRLYSDEAKGQFIPPDKRSLPFPLQYYGFQNK
ncbi:flavin reductase like domain-containing protein [Gorgonomyces haynaldii]|nr:flavin reductase like domain-containing protein [Gorgonomyces haynaldii]